MARVLIIAGLAALAFTVYALVDCALTTRVRGLPRWVWVLLILVLPVLGGALWFALGSGRLRAASARTGRPLGPDDDPDFLGSASRPIVTTVDEDRWQRLEQELAEIDADSDDDGDTRRA